jgi:hypothetical protein
MMSNETMSSRSVELAVLIDSTWASFPSRNKNRRLISKSRSINSRRLLQLESGAGAEYS